MSTAQQARGRHRTWMAPRSTLGTSVRIGGRLVDPNYGLVRPLRTFLRHSTDPRWATTSWVNALTGSG